MEELLDTYTRDGEYLGVRTRSECHVENPGFYHKPAWTWAYNSKGQVLVQKRAMSKKKFPGYWDMPCAGHVDAGETTKIGAIREAKEEIGVDVSEEEKSSYVVVPDYQLSLAIGKAGQNARLAAKLTNWKIDIKSETQAAEEPFAGFGNAEDGE